MKPVKPYYKKSRLSLKNLLSQQPAPQKATSSPTDAGEQSSRASMTDNPVTSLATTRISLRVSPLLGQVAFHCAVFAFAGAVLAGLYRVLIGYNKSGWLTNYFNLQAMPTIEQLANDSSMYFVLLMPFILVFLVLLMLSIIYGFDTVNSKCQETIRDIGTVIGKGLEGIMEIAAGCGGTVAGILIILGGFVVMAYYVVVNALKYLWLGTFYLGLYLCLMIDIFLKVSENFPPSICWGVFGAVIGTSIGLVDSSVKYKAPQVRVYAIAF